MGGFNLRPCLKIGNVSNGEGFFARQDDLTRQYFVYCKENQRSMAEKDPPSGLIDIFQTRPRRSYKGPAGFQIMLTHKKYGLLYIAIALLEKSRFFYSIFSIKSPTSQHSTFASTTRYSAWALLMFFCRCSYCWIVRTGTPDKSARSR